MAAGDQNSAFLRYKALAHNYNLPRGQVYLQNHQHGLPVVHCLSDCPLRTARTLEDNASGRAIFCRRISEKLILEYQIMLIVQI